MTWDPHTANEYFPVQALTVHHTAESVYLADPSATVRGIYNYQAVGEGWGDIGYHLLIDPFGIVYEGRYSGGSSQYPIFGSNQPLMATGAHVLGFNSGNIGICLLGDLTSTDATPAAKASLVTVLAYVAAVGHVNPTGSTSFHNPVNGYAANLPAGLVGHRDWAQRAIPPATTTATQCPGNSFYPNLGPIRAQVAAAMPAVPEPPPPQPSGSAEPSPSAGPEPSDNPVTGEPSASTEGSAPPPSAAASSQPPTTTTTKPTTAKPRERGGDAAGVKATPLPRPSQSLTPMATASDGALPSLTADGTPTGIDLPWAATTGGQDGSGMGWGIITAVGTTTTVAAAAAVGVWSLRRRRAVAEEAGTSDGSRSSTVEDLTVRPSTMDEPEKEAAAPQAPVTPNEPPASAVVNGASESSATTGNPTPDPPESPSAPAGESTD